MNVVQSNLKAFKQYRKEQHNTGKMFIWLKGVLEISLAICGLHLCTYKK